VPKFVYTLKDEKGRDYQGTIAAKDKKEAQAKLDTTGYYLVALSKEPLVLFSMFSPKITKMDIVVLARQLATMMSAGLPITKSLMALAEQCANDSLRRVINDIRSKIEGGFKLSEAMGKHPDVFSEFFVSLIETGETGGTLDMMLKRVSTYLEKEEELRRKIKGAFAYPMVVSVVAMIVVTYLVLFVVPVFKSVYAGMKVELPLPTIILITASVIVKKWWLLLSIFITGVVLWIKRAIKKEKARLLLDKIKISLPLFGALNTKVAVSRFVRSFGSLISSGIPISKALSVTERVSANKAITAAIDKVRVEVNRGESIAVALKAARLFPPIVIQMVAAGEESGALDDMLDKSAEFLDEEIDMAIKKLTVKLEPILTFGLAGIVGFIALAIYLPMFDIIKQISK